MARQQPVSQNAKIYRGRRRLPKLPSKRYFAVVSTAIMAAGVVALGADMILPDDLSNRQGAQALPDRFALADQAARGADDAPAISVDAGAADIWVLPLKDNYTISSEFAPRWGSIHYGIDLAAPYGLPIHATHAGTVVVADYWGGYGYCVQIDNGNGILTIFGHASSLNVVRDQQVKAGDVIAWVGSTGFSTGNHLHYEILVNGNQFDPERFMLERGVDLRNKTEAVTGG